MKTTLLFVLIATLSGCANMERRAVWNKQGEQPGDKDTAMTECNYEAIKHAGGYDSTLRTAVGQGLEMGMRRNEIFSACMKAKGWW